MKTDWRVPTGNIVDITLSIQNRLFCRQGESIIPTVHLQLRILCRRRNNVEMKKLVKENKRPALHEGSGISNELVASRIDGRASASRPRRDQRTEEERTDEDIIQP